MKSEKILKIFISLVILPGIGFILWVVINSLHETSVVDVKKSDKEHKIEQTVNNRESNGLLSHEIKADVKSYSKHEEDVDDSEQDCKIKKTEEEERSVEAFDKLTDKWMAPSKKPVSQNDVSTFVASFKAVPESRRDECIHRALNLIPDDNVLLLAGIMFDKSLGKDTIETVFNDILNRDEMVKRAIMKEIFKDKSHPCWADVAWILDVTGELPGK